MSDNNNQGLIDVTRLHVLKNLAKILSIPYSTLYIKKLRGDFETIVISGVEFVIEPEEGFKKILKKKKKN